MAWPKDAVIVDDEPHVRAFLRLVLKELGVAQVWEAGDGSEGFRLIQEHEPDLVLLDINLPLVSGLQVLEQAIERQPDLLVIMVTSESALKTVHDALRLGASAYVLKHAPKNEVLATIRETIEAREFDDEPPENEAD